MPAYEPEITSAKNARVRHAAALRDRRAREDAGLTLVDGVRELERALAGGARPAEVFADLSRLDAHGRDLLALARERGALVLPTAGPALDRLAYGDRSEGVVASIRMPDVSLDALRLPPDPLIVVLEGVEKPGNLGAVIRSADGAGVDAVIAADPRTDLFNPNAIRASLGAIFAVPLAQGTSAEVQAWLARRGIEVVTARVDAPEAYTDADLSGPVAIVLGSEAEGLSDRWPSPPARPVRLPMRGVGDSLNVSIAAAVLVYEAQRQRGAG
ncbi:MAG TPA: RNA methyltransferase [Acidimicrobiales bacterium]|nr:RNA methyltransferase [Acidimicrobiales bacterium]